MDGSGFRFTNPRSTGTYLRNAEKGVFAPAHIEARSQEDCEDEAVWLALRTSDGIFRKTHAERYGGDPLAMPSRAQAAQGCVAAGWLEITAEAVRLTQAGFLFADEVAVRLSRMA
jgi:coproporphyrinogen III oxidase-like Fe-S oxidoreductase